MSELTIERTEEGVAAVFIVAGTVQVKCYPINRVPALTHQIIMDMEKERPCRPGP
ncbi:MAG: hypothetical protein GY940_40295 [bacterium]|nr:hypothetical protein [bacterium]